jgi:hypothetical protein
MRKIISSRLSLSVGSLFVLAVSVSSCVKSRADRTDFSNLQAMVLIPEGGMATFAKQALTFPNSDAFDTSFFHVNYAAKNVAPSDETIGLSIDQAALASYNGANTVQYELFPDSIFSFSTTSVSIPAGANYSQAIPLVVYPDKVDPTKNYMLPISISTVPSGAGVAANYKTIFYHLIGNPIAGSYDEEWKRWNKADTSGAPDFDLDLGTVIFAPTDPTTISVTSPGTGETDDITFTNTGGVLSNFNVTLEPLAGITEGPAILLQADPVNGVYIVFFSYTNSTGAPRTIENIFRKQ